MVNHTQELPAACLSLQPIPSLHCAGFVHTCEPPSLHIPDSVHSPTNMYPEEAKSGRSPCRSWQWTGAYGVPGEILGYLEFCLGDPKYLEHSLGGHVPLGTRDFPPQGGGPQPKMARAEPFTAWGPGWDLGGQRLEQYSCLSITKTKTRAKYFHGSGPFSLDGALFSRSWCIVSTYLSLHFHYPGPATVLSPRPLLSTSSPSSTGSRSTCNGDLLF